MPRVSARKTDYTESWWVENSMSRRLILIALLTSAPGLGWSQSDSSYICTYGELTRRVVVMSEPGVSVPCEVQYFKDSEAPGESRVLWSASNQEGYCEARAAEFAAKLENWGWRCSSTADALPAAPSDSVVDDSDALEPVQTSTEGEDIEN